MTELSSSSTMNLQNWWLIFLLGLAIGATTCGTAKPEEKKEASKKGHGSLRDDVGILRILAFCEGRVSAFFVSDNMNINSSAATVLKNVTEARCLDLCASNRDPKGRWVFCASAVYDRESAQCAIHRRASTPDGEAGRRSESGKRYFEKFCLAEDIPLDCADRQFVRVDEFILKGYAQTTATFSTMAECAAHCVREKKFACKSAMYFYEEGECITNTESAITRPDDFMRPDDEDKVVFFHNGCINDAGKEADGQDKTKEHASSPPSTRAPTTASSSTTKATTKTTTTTTFSTTSRSTPSSSTTTTPPSIGGHKILPIVGKNTRKEQRRHPISTRRQEHSPPSSSSVQIEETRDEEVVAAGAVKKHHDREDKSEPMELPFSPMTPSANTETGPASTTTATTAPTSPQSDTEGATKGREDEVGKNGGTEVENGEENNTESAKEDKSHPASKRPKLYGATAIVRGLPIQERSAIDSIKERNTASSALLPLSPADVTNSDGEKSDPHPTAKERADKEDDDGGNSPTGGDGMMAVDGSTQDAAPRARMPMQIQQQRQRPRTQPVHVATPPEGGSKLDVKPIRQTLPPIEQTEATAPPTTTITTTASPTPPPSTSPTTSAGPNPLQHTTDASDSHKRAGSSNGGESGFFSDWGEWTPCTEPGERRVRRRRCLDLRRCKGALMQVDYCPRGPKVPLPQADSNTVAEQQEPSGLAPPPVRNPLPVDASLRSADPSGAAPPSILPQKLPEKELKPLPEGAPGSPTDLWSPWLGVLNQVQEAVINADNRVKELEREKAALERTIQQLSFDKADLRRIIMLLLRRIPLPTLPQAQVPPGGAGSRMMMRRSSGMMMRRRSALSNDSC